MGRCESKKKIMKKEILRCAQNDKGGQLTLTSFLRLRYGHYRGSLFRWLFW